MARESIPLVREGGFSNAEKLFVLSYEGDITEKKYFEDLRCSEYFNDGGLIELISLKKAKNKGSDPFNVKKLLKDAKNEYGFKKSDEFWLIVDRDDWETIHRHSFDELYDECEKEGNFFVALSNPCFEIWLISHLIDISEIPFYEQKLILENARVSSSKNYIDKFLGDLQGRGYNKRANPQIFLPLVTKAIENLKKSSCADERYPSTLGTHVYKLVEKLIR